MLHKLIKRSEPTVETFAIVDLNDAPHLYPKANEIVFVEMNHDGYTVYRNTREIPWEQMP